MDNPNLQLLTDAAKLLKPVVGELVFVGGCVTPLLISQLPGRRNWAMAGGSNGYEAALARRHLGRC
jgi:hypothetical protein